MNQLFTPLSIKGLSLKNRIVFAPTSMGMAGIDIYDRIALGGAGLLILADISVIPSILGAPSLDSGRYNAYFQEIIHVCHKYGCKVSAQLFHPEYDAEYIGQLFQQAKKNGAVSPDEIRKELKKSTRTFCDKLQKAQINAITENFSQAAARAKNLGFDMVQIHGDRLIGSFASPLFNHRKDEYRDHGLFAAEVVKAVRLAVPELPIDYKLTIRLDKEQLGRGGISLEETPDFVRTLDVCGVNSYHVSIANHTDIKDTIPAKDHPKLLEEGCFSFLALEVKKYTKNPVCAVGKLQHMDKMEELLKGGIDLIGMSRQLIADPAWPEKAESGNADQIKYCLYCNQMCLNALKGGGSIKCVLHSNKKWEDSIG